MRSWVGKKTSKSTAPDAIFETASSVVVKNVSSTLTPYSFEKSFDLGQRYPSSLDLSAALGPSRRDHRVVVERGTCGRRASRAGAGRLEVAVSTRRKPKIVQARQPDTPAGIGQEFARPYSITWMLHSHLPGCKPPAE